VCFHCLTKIQHPMAHHHATTSWSSGLCDCCESASTCKNQYAYCNRQRNRSLKDLIFIPLCDMLTPAVLTACGVPLIAPPAALSLRAAMRNRYNIQGSLCNDIIVSCFCSWCLWCQMHRELKHRKKQPTRFLNLVVSTVKIFLLVSSL
uniref:Plac8 onzin related protein 2 n=1 Tax=Monopterus albus TaxID=43700 RepID=A0A3Q3K167_MONAL